MKSAFSARARVAGAWLLASLAAAAASAAPGPAASPRMIPLPEPVPETRFTEQAQGEVRFDSRAPFDFDLLLNHLDRAPKVSALGYLYLPQGASASAPVPAVVVLPGSGGLKIGRQMLHANNLVAAGYAVLVIDYYAARNVNDDKVPYAVMVSNVTEFDVVTDAYGALKALNRHPAIDASRIGVLGFSYGGMAVRLALDTRLKNLLAPGVAPFAAHVDYYGPCFQDFGTESTTGAPLLTLRGAGDASNDLVRCTVREEQLRSAGSEVSSHVYATAGHSWDNLDPRVLNASNYVRGCEMVYDRRGFPSVGGNRMITEDAPLDRDARYALRMESGRFLAGCVKNGYVVGRDQPVYEHSNRELFEFLDRTLRATAPVPRS